jgi:hypothetical protein
MEPFLRGGYSLACHSGRRQGLLDGYTRDAQPECPGERGRSPVGELGRIRRYSYWSDRRIKEIAADNNISLDKRWLMTFQSPAIGALPQIGINEGQRKLQRHAVAERIEGSIGQLAVEDFVTPPAAAFAKGRTPITFARYTRLSDLRAGKKGDGVIIHTRTASSNGTKVEICLFGSIENCIDYLPGSDVVTPAVWRASSTQAIEEFMRHRGKKKAPIYDDGESIAVEILRTINNEGMIGKRAFKSIQSAEWFAEVFHDVELDKSRWDLRPGRDLPEPVDRIVIGAPLWVRTAP